MNLPTISLFTISSPYMSLTLKTSFQRFKPGVVSPKPIFPEAPETGSPRDDAVGGSRVSASLRGGYADSVVRKMKMDTGFYCGLSKSSSMDRLQECMMECVPLVAGDSALFNSHYR